MTWVVLLPRETALYCEGAALQCLTPHDVGLAVLQPMDTIYFKINSYYNIIMIIKDKMLVKFFLSCTHTCTHVHTHTHMLTQECS